MRATTTTPVDKSTADECAMAVIEDLVPKKLQAALREDEPLDVGRDMTARGAHFLGDHEAQRRRDQYRATRTSAITPWL